MYKKDEDQKMNELVTQNTKIVQMAMHPTEIKEQIGLIQHVMKDVMKDTVHFGKIPGCGDKPALYQAGAEKIMLLFRFRPSFLILSSVESDTFLSYTIKCDLYHIPTEQLVGSGLGSCNSKETKYRYRNVIINTPVPKEYWTAREKGDVEGMEKALGGEKREVRKIKTGWMILSRVENENPWDFQNTLLKMAAKRAKVSAVLNATAASDIFTQDIEDLPREFREEFNPVNDTHDLQNEAHNPPIDVKTENTSSPSKPSYLTPKTPNMPTQNIPSVSPPSSNQATSNPESQASNIPKPSSNLFYTPKEAETPKSKMIKDIYDLSVKYYSGDEESINIYLHQFIKKGKKIEDLSIDTLQEIISDLKKSLKQIPAF